MNLLHRLTKKNLQLNKKRTIVTIIGIMLSVALITAVSTVFMSGYKSIINFEKIYEGDYHVVFKGVPEEDKSLFDNNRDIEGYYTAKEIGYDYLENGKNEYKPYILVKAFDETGLKKGGFVLLEGRLPENDNEVVIPSHLKTNGRVKLNVGETITLNLGKRIDCHGTELTQDNSLINYESIDEEENKEVCEEKITDQSKKTYKIVGISERPSKVVEPYSSPAYTFITYKKNNSGKNDYYVRYTKKALKNYEKTTAKILGFDEVTIMKLLDNTLTDEDYEEIFEKELYAVDANQYLITLEADFFKNNIMKSLGSVVAVVIGIIIVTSVFCIKNSFDISIAEKTKQYGMLASVGATKKQIRKNVYYEAFRLGLVGLPLGILLGLFASYILIIISNFLLREMVPYDFLAFSISLPAIGVAIVLGIITLFLSSLRSAHKASKIAPITAIRNSEEIKINPKKIKSPKLIKKIFGVGGEISYKNLKRSKKKYRTTVISIIVSVAIFISLSSLMGLLYETIKEEYSGKDYTLIVNYRLDGMENEKQKREQIINLNGVKDYAIMNTLGNFAITNEEIDYSKEYKKIDHSQSNPYVNNEGLGEFKGLFITRIGEHAYNKYLKKLGLKEEDVKGKGILFNYANVYDAKEQDYNRIEYYDIKNVKQLHISSIEYDEDKQEDYLKERTDIEIVLVTLEKPFGLSLMGAPVLILDDETYNKLVPDQVPYNEILIDAENADDLQDEIEKILENDDASITNILEEVRMLRSFMLLIGIFLYGFIVVITLIGVTNIFNTITTNMELRQKEFAMLKSVGMTKKEFNRMVSLETFFYGTKALLIGLPIGVALSILLYKLLTEGLSMKHYPVPYIPVLISIVAVFVLITCIMKYSVRKINKQNIIETIRNENI